MENKPDSKLNNTNEDMSRDVKNCAEAKECSNVQTEARQRGRTAGSDNIADGDDIGFSTNKAGHEPENAVASDGTAAAKTRHLRAGAVAALIIVTALIVTLIAGSIVLSGRRTSAAEKNKADRFAQSLAATLSKKGQENVEKQFWNGYNIKNSGKFSGLMFDVTDDYENYGPADSSFSILKKDGENELPSYGDVRRYAITGAKYQDRTYDVAIEYDPSDYEDDSSEDAKSYNVNSFPDVKSLSSEKTAVVNPESAYLTFDTDANGEYEYDSLSGNFKYKGSSLEDTAVEQFYAKYTSFYENAVSTVNSYLSQNGFDSAHMLKGSDFIQSSAKDSKETSMKKSISRNTTLYAYKSGDGTAFRSNVVFTLSDVTEIGMPNVVTDALSTRLQGSTITQIQHDGTSLTRQAGATDISAAISALQPQIQALWNSATTTAALQVQFMVYESDKSFDSLDSIYLMYYPLRLSEWESDMISIDISGIRSDYSTDDKLNLYIVPQIGLLSNETGMPFGSIQGAEYIAPKLAGGTITYGGGGLADTSVSVANAGTLFDMTRIRVNYLKGWFRTLAAADMNDSIVAKSSPQDIVYDLKISVYKSSDGRFSDKDLITTRRVSLT